VHGIVLCNSRKPKEQKKEKPPVDQADEEMSSVASIHDPEKYREVFCSRHKLCKLTEFCCLMDHSLCNIEIIIMGSGVSLSQAYCCSDVETVVVVLCSLLLTCWEFK